MKPLMPSSQVPPLWQGLSAHSSMLMWHMLPAGGAGSDTAGSAGGVSAPNPSAHVLRGTGPASGLCTHATCTHTGPPPRGPGGRAGQQHLGRRTPWTCPAQRVAAGLNRPGHLALLLACRAGSDQERAARGRPPWPRPKPQSFRGLCCRQPRLAFGWQGPPTRRQGPQTCPIPATLSRGEAVRRAGDRALLSCSRRLTRVARLTRTLVAVDLVQTGARVTGVAGTVVQVDLTVGSWAGGQAVSSSPLSLGAPRPAHRGTCGPLEAEAEVGIVAVLAGAPVAAGLAVALIDVGLAVVTGVAGPAQAGEGGDAVLAGPVVTRVGAALVDVHLAVGPRVACRAGPGDSRWPRAHSCPCPTARPRAPGARVGEDQAA